MRMPAGRPGCGYAQVALLHSKAPTLPPDVLRHQPPEKNNLVRNDLLEGTSRRSRDEILEAAGHHAHVTRRTQGPFRPSSPQSFYRHHLSAISSAIVHADALVVRAQAESYAFMLTLDVRRS